MSKLIFGKRIVKPFHSSPKVRYRQNVETNGGEQNEKETSKYLLLTKQFKQFVMFHGVEL